MASEYSSSIRKVLVLNGSPRKALSNTMVVTRAFLEGLDKDHSLEVETVNIADLKVTPCLGCLSCWGRSEGECIIRNDDIPALKKKILESDIVISSFPLYFFSMPGILKIVTDRLLSLMLTYEGQKASQNGQSFHGLRYDDPKKRFLVISTCAYTDTSCYQSLLSQLDAICGKRRYTPILVPQMKTLVDLKNEAKLNRYLSKFKIAGEHFRESGFLSDEEIANLSKPPFSEGAYKIFLGNFWEEERNHGK